MDSQTIIHIAIVLIVAVIFFIYLYWEIKKRGLKEFAIDMILEAEDALEKGQNSEKMKYVIVRIKEFLSLSKIGSILCLFLTDENIEEFIQDIFNGIKKALDYVPKKESEEQ